VCQNLHPSLAGGDGVEAFLALLSPTSFLKSSNVARLLPRVFERLLDPKVDPKGATLLFRLMLGLQATDPDVARQCLATLTAKIQTGEIHGDLLAQWADKAKPALAKVLAGKPDAPIFIDAALLAATLRDSAGLEIVRKSFASSERPEAVRLRAL